MQRPRSSVIRAPAPHAVDEGSNQAVFHILRYTALELLFRRLKRQAGGVHLQLAAGAFGHAFDFLLGLRLDSIDVALGLVPYALSFRSHFVTHRGAQALDLTA